MLKNIFSGVQKGTFREDRRKMYSDAHLYILMDRFNISLIEYLVSRGYNIAGVFTDVDQLKLELAVSADKFRLLIIDSGRGLLNLSAVISKVCDLITLCVEGNKCALITSNNSLIDNLERSARENNVSMLVEEYDGVLGVHSLLATLDETYVQDTAFMESLENLVDLNKVTSLVYVEPEDVYTLQRDYNTLVRNMYSKVSLGDSGIEAFNFIKV